MTMRDTLLLVLSFYFNIAALVLIPGWWGRIGTQRGFRAFLTGWVALTGAWASSFIPLVWPLTTA
jgi:hypothetical protein